MSVTTTVKNKLLVLSLVRQCPFCLSNAQITDFLVANEYNTYFSVQKVLNELLSSQLLSATQVENTTYYRMTPEGEQTLFGAKVRFTKQEKNSITDYLQKLNEDAAHKGKASVFADYIPSKEGEYTVNCFVREKGVNLIELHLTVPDPEQASLICLQWEEKCEEIYSYLMMQLMSTP